MPPPAVHPVTAAIYNQLPEHYRLADAAQANPDYPLLRFLSLTCDQLGEIVDLVDRINYVAPGDGGAAGDTSDLGDPATADPAWLPWLAQFVGVDLLTGGLSVAEQRDAITSAASGWRAGTKAAMADAARSALTGTKYVRIIDHYTGDEWLVEVRTLASETPDVAAVLEAIVTKNAKPAGVELVPVAYQATWAQVNAAYPTWGDLAGLTWQDVLETGA